ncbi:phosphatidylethanolamine-binding protein 4 isoform X2 [Vanacampus margaritifer]
MTVLPVFLLLCGSMWGTRHGGVTAGTLSSEDASFCRDGLEVLYPELHVDGCLIVPKDDRNLRKKLTTEWEAPTIRYPEADENTFYTLVMVDPDAPSRSSPSQRYWRHWLVTDVKVVGIWRPLSLVLFWENLWPGCNSSRNTPKTEDPRRGFPGPVW